MQTAASISISQHLQIIIRVAESGDAFGHLDEIRRSRRRDLGHKVHYGLFSLAVISRRQRIGCARGGYDQRNRADQRGSKYIVFGSPAHRPIGSEASYQDLQPTTSPAELDSKSSYHTGNIKHKPPTLVRFMTNQSLAPIKTSTPPRVQPTRWNPHPPKCSRHGDDSGLEFRSSLPGSIPNICRPPQI